ncbi:shikimate dehydrogenase family protein [Lutimonas sp.]|uniref:shikimate dehydrogenase family protein n=1 Tax=Lutimonas sp. TaxID=1872403 RepID=UPI003D9AE22B
MEKRFGLVGKNISYSFSRKYFTEKFQELNLNQFEYVNYDLGKIIEFSDKVLVDADFLGGLNVTIPYKEQIIPFLDEIDSEAKSIGAVNTIKMLKGGRLKGYNTDAYGFETSLKNCWKGDEQGALILGTGGASKAIAFVMKKLHIPFLFVSRSKKKEHTILYEEVDEQILKNHELIINCSPLGTFPDIDLKPNLPYEYIGQRHLLFDLIYNPERTAFLKMGEKAGAIVQNGASMLKHQADRSWEIWNS